MDVDIILWVSISNETTLRQIAINRRKTSLITFHTLAIPYRTTIQSKHTN